MLEVGYRTLQNPDLPQLLELLQELNPKDPILEPKNDLELMWESMNNSSNFLHLGAFLKNNPSTLIASCSLSVIPNLTRNACPFAVIENVITKASYRKQGIGTGLLQYAFQLAKARNCYKVMLMTGKTDVATLDFYEKAGFERNKKTAFVRYF